MDLSAVYFPTAVALGSLHALEPGHAKTLTAAYLIGTKGTKRDAVLLGLSVAFTHSLVVVGLCVGAVLLGREAFTDEAAHWLAVGSGVIVISLGSWLLVRRLRVLRRALHEHTHEHHQHPHVGHDHSDMTDDEHARAHAADLPEYVGTGERPSAWQVMAFGAAGGLIPCPAAVTVMLLSLSLSKTGKGLFLVAGFSTGLAITLVGVGLAVVVGLSKISGTGRMSAISRHAPIVSAGLVIVSGAAGVVVALVKGT